MIGNLTYNDLTLKLAILHEAKANSMYRVDGKRRKRRGSKRGEEEEKRRKGREGEGKRKSWKKTEKAKKKRTPAITRIFTLFFFSLTLDQPLSSSQGSSSQPSTPNSHGNANSNSNSNSNVHTTHKPEDDRKFSPREGIFFVFFSFGWLSFVFWSFSCHFL